VDFAPFIHSAQYAEYRYCALPRYALTRRRLAKAIAPNPIPNSPMVEGSGMVPPPAALIDI